MSRARILAPLPLLTLALAAGCASTKTPTVSAEAKLEAAYAEQLAPATPEEIEEIERADALTRANFWAAEFRKDPSDLDVTQRFASVLREIGSHERAIDVLSKTIPLHPQADGLQMIMGRALLSENRPGEAAEAFYKASVIAPGNAAAHAGLGVALDRLERHHDAQTSYRAALEIEPQRVSTLTNYGLSLALSGDLTGAEQQLRMAAAYPSADGRVRQNLALILGLQGRFEEMREIDPHAPQRTVEANLTAIKAMLAPTRDYGALREDSAPKVAITVPSSPPETRQAAEQQTPERKPAIPQLRGSLRP